MTKRSEDHYIQCPEAMEGTAGKAGIAKHTRASISVTAAGKQEEKSASTSSNDSQ